MSELIKHSITGRGVVRRPDGDMVFDELQIYITTLSRTDSDLYLAGTIDIADDGRLVPAAVGVAPCPACGHSIASRLCCSYAQTESHRRMFALRSGQRALSADQLQALVLSIVSQVPAEQTRLIDCVSVLSPQNTRLEIQSAVASLISAGMMGFDSNLALCAGSTKGFAHE